MGSPLGTAGSHRGGDLSAIATGHGQEGGTNSPSGRQEKVVPGGMNQSDLLWFWGGRWQAPGQPVHRLKLLCAQLRLVLPL